MQNFIDQLNVTTIPNMEDLKIFMDKCKNLGYINNANLKNLKLDFVKENLGTMHYVYKKDKIIAMSGCHKFVDMGDNAFRVAFRSAQLPKEDVFKGLSKYYFNSIPWRLCLPLEIQHCLKQNCNNIYVTTNINRHDSRFSKADRNMQLLTTFDVVQYVCTKEIYYTEQNVWKLNVDKYLKLRSNL